MTVLTTLTTGAFLAGGAGGSNLGGKKVKIQTLSGVGIKGKHFDAFMIIDVDEEDANICVGSGKARFVVNEALAQEENAKTREAAGLDAAPMSKKPSGK